MTFARSVCDNGEMEWALLAVAVALALVAATLARKLQAAGQKAALAEAGRAEAQTQAEAATSRLDAAVAARVDAERSLAAAQQRLGDLEHVLKDADTARQDLVTAARSAALETARELSAQLIGDHRRETLAAKADAESQFRQISEPLLQRIETIAKAHAELSGQVQEGGKAIDTLMRSLSSPGGAGQIAEIGLANTLKAMGLEAGRDYVLQASTTDEVTGQRLRPDALVFLPGNSVIIIDCKSSKYLLEIAEATSEAREASAYASFAQTMNGHLKALAGKDYRSAILADLRAADRPGESARVSTAMYLPNEAALEKLGRADAGFFAKAREAQIFPVGPAGLYSLVSLAAAEIIKERQAENQQRIIDAAQNLVEAVATALGAIAGVGKGIKAAAEAYEKFTRSVNQRLLPRARKLASLGVQPGKILPSSLPAYTVMSQENDRLIEGEAEELEEPQAPRLLAE